MNVSQKVPLQIPKDLVANIQVLTEIGNAYAYQGNLNQAESFWQQALDRSLASKDIEYIFATREGLGRTLFNERGKQPCRNPFPAKPAFIRGISRAVLKVAGLNAEALRRLAQRTQPVEGSLRNDG